LEGRREKYQIYLGGDKSNTRLNRLYKDNVMDSEIAIELHSVLKAFVDGAKKAKVLAIGAFAPF
jgi:sulfite reductase beta subunit-like hemoprotein